MDYWKDCVSEAFEDAKILASADQISTVTSWIEGAVENESMARGYDSIPNPLSLENDKLKVALKKEANKIICAACKGKRYSISYGPVRSSEHTCYACNGNGWVY